MCSSWATMTLLFIIYLDDIIHFSTTFDQLVKKPRAVYSRLSAAGLNLKSSKCCFVQK